MKLHARKAQKAGGGLCFFPFLPKIRVSRAWGFPRCGGVPEGHWGVFFILGVAEWRILRPQVVSLPLLDLFSAYFILFEKALSATLKKIE